MLPGRVRRPRSRPAAGVLAGLVAALVAGVALAAPTDAPRTWSADGLASTTSSYGWPLRPFHVAHPVRGYFNDPRFLPRTQAFHYGIDIAAPAGAPVYAVESGVAHVSSDWIAVVARGRTFGYWHVDSLVRDHARVRAHEAIGHVQPRGAHQHYADGRHVHFTEVVDGEYRDPLRPGALAPWVDDTVPSVRRIGFLRNGRPLARTGVSGRVDVVVEAFDTPPLPVPPPWASMPVTPGRLSWRVLRASTLVQSWQTPVDFRHTLLPRTQFWEVFAPGTRQNRPSSPGRYLFFLEHAWDTRFLAEGRYRLEVEASDQYGNVGRAVFAFGVTNRSTALDR